MRLMISRIRQEIKLVRLLVSDKRTPTLARLLLWLAAGYLLLPFDIIPDFIPVLGQIDDIIIIPLLVGLAYRIIPEELVREHLCQLQTMRR